ncbi:MAG TPA: polyketide synthase, partial [Chloroflexota bacterium]
MQARVRSMERARNEPIAIVGMGCRFPGGADDPDAFWRVLANGVDAVREVPPERWDVDAFYDPDPAAPGKMYTRAGGFIRQADRFDHSFFGIAPREAAAMDPQQRLLLEVTWEALEDAGQPPHGLIGSRTGVFVGISTTDYAQLGARDGDATAIDAYSGTGTAFSVAAGRISYVLGFRGPCLAVDTACSSSLVALHNACQSLRLGESDVALVGGVNLILAPESSVYFCKVHAMAVDGRCKTFDADADGYGRGEGCGVVVLKRMSDAVAAGDRIHALVRGSAINHDGRSGGLTVPNGPAQQSLMRDALAAARVSPLDVDYVEAHGTGTPLGDPIELVALGAVYGDGRANDRPLLVGSAKTNLGHLEAAAGIAGLIKTVLMLEHRQVAPHLNLRTPSPHIPWADLPIRVPRDLTEWPKGDSPRLAAVSSFGFSGTNAHVVLEEAPAPSDLARDALERAHVLPISARTPEALAELTERFASQLAEMPNADLASLCTSAQQDRTHFGERLAVLGETREAMEGSLRGSGKGVY